MSDFDEDEISMRRLFAALREGWRSRTDIADRVHARLELFDERYAMPSADRWVVLRFSATSMAVQTDTGEEMMVPCAGVLQSVVRHERAPMAPVEPAKVVEAAEEPAPPDQDP